MLENGGVHPRILNLASRWSYTSAPVTPTSTHRMGHWVGRRVGVGVLWKRKISYPCRDLNHDFWAVFARLNFELSLPSDEVTGSGYCNLVTNISLIALLILSTHGRVISDQNNCRSFRVTVDRPPGSYFLSWNVCLDSAPRHASFGLSNFATCRRFVVFFEKNNCHIIRAALHWKKLSSNDKHVIVVIFITTNLGGWRDFPHLSRPALGPTQPPVQSAPFLSRG
jgi:hypothetical protein